MVNKTNFKVQCEKSHDAIVLALRLSKSAPWINILSAGSDMIYISFPADKIAIVKPLVSLCSCGCAEYSVTTDKNIMMCSFEPLVL